MWNVSVESFLGQGDMSRLSFVLSNKAWADMFLGLGSGLYSSDWRFSLETFLVGFFYNSNTKMVELID